MKFIFLLLVFFFFLSNCMSYSQSNKRYKGRHKSSKRDIKRNIQDSEEKQEEDTPFAPSKKSGRNESELRDDFIWKTQSGQTVSSNTGNVSLFEASRFGISNTIELESYLVADYWIPNLFVKKQWINSKKWKFASRHGAYSATPGFENLISHNNYQFIDSLSNISTVISVKNEFLLSRPFINAYSCNGQLPYMIVTGGISFDYGLPIEKSDVILENKHFWNNRGMAMTANGFYISVLGRIDYQLNPSLIASGSIRYFYGNFVGKNALETKLFCEAFLNNSISVSGGLGISFGSYSTKSNVGFAPVIDICYYFGHKQSREKGLFGTKMF
jgi:hypothetical protein